MRSRLEDLGRIMILVENLIDLEVWDAFNDKPKRSPEWFKSLSEEQRDDAIRKIAYGMESVKEHLYKVLEICQGQDYLNQPEGEEASKGEYF